MPKVMWERPWEADELDERPAKTSVYRRTWFKVPAGPWPCEVCGDYLRPGTRALRSIVSGEAFYRHPACTRTQPTQPGSTPGGGSEQAEFGESE